MKRILLLYLITICTSSVLIAQNTLTGKLIDEKSGDALPYSNVVLKSGKSQKVVTSDINGVFKFEGLNKGKYSIEISYLGYMPFKRKVIVVSKGQNDLGIIEIKPSTEVLEEVVIEEEPSAFTTTLDGLEINPEKSIAQQGGSVLDILQNSPSINVDQDGNITLRGTSSTNILINGRNSSMVRNLEAIPASAVKKIAINNNPGAKYDAQGQGGIINIDLKDGTSEEQKGFFGNASATAGNFGRYNASLGLNYGWEKFKLSANYNRRNSYRGSNGITNRTNISSGEEIRQTSDRDGYRFSDNMTLGFNIFPNSKNTIDISSNLLLRGSDTEENVYNLILDSLNDPISNTLRTSDKRGNGYNIENSVSWTRKYVRGSKLIISGSNSYNDNGDKNNYTAYNRSNGDIDRVLSEQRSTNDNQNTITTGQIDYTHQLTEDVILEGGAKTIYRNIDTDFLLENYNMSRQEFETNLDASNFFQYDEQVYAAYLSYKATKNDFQYYAGLRAEQTIIDTRLVRTNETNDQNYLSFFPSAKISYNLDEKQLVKLTYSRRIDRPGAWRLNPFVDISDSLNIYQGNPNLLPEFINSFELGHNVNYKKSSFTTTLFYRHVKNQMDWVSRFREDEGFAFRGPANLDYADNIGLELISQVSITEWWGFNGSITLFYASIVGDVEGINYNNSNFTSNAQINTNFKLPWKIDAQLTFDYEGPEAEAQGNETARYNFDIGLKKPILENGYISFNARDIFNTLNRTENSSGPGFEQYRKRDWQSRIFQFGLGYQF